MVCKQPVQFHTQVCWCLGEGQAFSVKTLTLLIPTQYVVVPATVWDGSFGRFNYGTAEVLISLLNIGGTRDVKLCMASLVRRL